MFHRIRKTRVSFRSGMTLVDLCVMLFLMTVLFGAVLPVLAVKENDTNNRIKCASNLKQIGMAMLLYANENRGEFARTLWVSDNEKLTAFSKPDKEDPFALGEDGVDPNDVTAPIFLLDRKSVV